MAYNTLKVWAAYEVLGSSDLNSNMSNLDFLKSQVIIQTVAGRLSLESGVAISTTDQTGKTTLYFVPFRGNKVGLYDSVAATWDLYTFSETSLSLSGLIKGVMYDIFGYLSGGTLALESLAWKKVTATNNPTAGSSKTVLIADTATLAVGGEATIKDGSNQEVTTIEAVNSGVSITVSLANSYTTPDVYGYQARETALTYNSGVMIKSGDATRRYLGTIRINRTTAGQCEDTQAERYVWNMYNRVERTLWCYCNAGDWTYSDAVWRPANGLKTVGLYRVWVVVGLSEDPVKLTNMAGADCDTGGVALAGISVDSDTTIPSTLLRGARGYEAGYMEAKWSGYPGIGQHFFQRMEYAAAGSINWYGTHSGAVYGMSGSCLA